MYSRSARSQSPRAGYKDDMKYFPPHNTDEGRKRRDGMCNGAFVYGTKGVIEYGHHGANYLRLLLDVTLEKLRADGGCPKQKYARVPGKSPDSKPYNEFLAAIKGGPKVGSDFAYAGAMTQCSLTGVAALFDAGRTLQWDPVKHLFTNGTASLIGITSLLFNAKGNPVGQALTVVFSLIYGYISYACAYYGEMITYLGMTAPMALLALISWLRSRPRATQSFSSWFRGRTGLRIRAEGRMPLWYRASFRRA